MRTKRLKCTLGLSNKIQERTDCTFESRETGVERDRMFASVLYFVLLVIPFILQTILFSNEICSPFAEQDELNPVHFSFLSVVVRLTRFNCVLDTMPWGHTDLERPFVSLSLRMNKGIIRCPSLTHVESIQLFHYPRRLTGCNRTFKWQERKMK